LSSYLSDEEGEFLVKLARKAVEEHLKTKKRITPSQNISEKLLKHCGTFVTINSKKNGEKQLRGCIGYPYPTASLVQAIIDSAIAAATEDPRFRPISLKELEKVVFEVSVLTPPQTVEVKKPTDYPKKIKIGEDGLIVGKGIARGLLLPQVPVEWKWDEEEFLCQCCVKAGLPPDCWLMKDTEISKFQAIIFEEETPRGKVILKTLGGK
jgi:uncharacterized protein (TIGR00296 family)